MSTSVRRALVISLVERYLLIVLALASNIILARLLTPDQIGIYSVSLAVIGIAQVLRDFGIGNFLIQAKELSEDHVRTAFGLSLLIGGFLFLLTVFAAPWASAFYSDSRMIATLQITSLNFLILPFCTVSLALLRREMQFQRLLYVTLTAALVGFIVTVSLAVLSFGHNSMAIGALVTNAVTGFGAWLARDSRRILSPGLAEWRTLLNFGAQTSLANVVTTISMDINDLALGRILGFSPVAMISRAQGLTNMFGREIMGAIRNVALPAFSKAHRNGEYLENKFVSSVSAVTAIAWPFYGFLAIYSLEIVRLMYGPQWDGAAALVPIFAAAGAVLAPSGLINTFLTAIGRNDMVTRAELLFQPLRAVAIVAAAMIYHSLTACAIATLVALVLYTPFIFHVKARCSTSDWCGLMRSLRLSLSVAMLALCLPLGMSIAAGISRTSPTGGIYFASAAILTVVSWIVALHWLRHPISSDPIFVSALQKIPLARYYLRPLDR